MLLTVGALALATSACSATPSPAPNLILGKQQFVAKCGACHALSRAQTVGTVGPNLDEAFRVSISDGEGRGLIRGVVEHQIEYPNPHGAMPAGLVHGAAVADIAAYVEQSASAGGSDSGLLAEATKANVGAGVATTPLLKEGKEVVLGASGCSSCHVLADAASTGTIGPDLDKRLRSDCESPASKPARGTTLTQCITTAITKPSAYIPAGYTSGIMPATFATRLSPKQIGALVAYLAKATEAKK
ncbi:MAG: c-type cytochrome [Acidobacteriota bacterium]|nr:c-type cytochrome [Acidobacteriota bacterium]